MKEKVKPIPTTPLAPVAFRDVQRATSLVFYLRDHLHVTRGADLLTAVMSYVHSECLALPVEYVAALCMTVAGEYRAAEGKAA